MQCINARTVLWVSATIVSAMMAFGAGGSAQEARTGEQILNASCLSCHDLEPVYRRHLDRDAWVEVVNTMVEEGAQLQPNDVSTLVDYLVRHHGPLPEGPGKALLEARCTACHDLTRVTEQRLELVFWEDVLDHMRSEGSELTLEEFPILAHYLATHFGPGQ